MDLEWRGRAACRGHDPRMWELGQGPPGVLQQAAKRICAGCPVRLECLRFGKSTGSEGMIFGGKSFKQSNRKSRVSEPAPDIKCRWCKTQTTGSHNGKKSFCSDKCRLTWAAADKKRARAEAKSANKAQLADPVFLA